MKRLLKKPPPKLRPLKRLLKKAPTPLLLALKPLPLVPTLLLLVQKLLLRLLTLLLPPLLRLTPLLLRPLLLRLKKRSKSQPFGALTETRFGRSSLGKAAFFFARNRMKPDGPVRRRQTQARRRKGIFRCRPHPSA
ncbi:hypothetical protein [Sphingopyxis sp. OAS728]|uniref:hypothetical protein n=1 Tax=Sphingopyxis sp. OAS728 TaxID=2663823 RepID=UPI00178C02F5|nr:hypothetical protein [Sphingopyxis sp. OAS728]